MMIYEHMGMKKTAMEWLNYWIAERESIRILKEDGERGDWRPWSNDPIFQTTYFCNVRREDDKVTRWIRQNWTPQVWGWELYDYSIVLARMLNNIPCLSAIDEAANQQDQDDPSLAISDFPELHKLLDYRTFHQWEQVWGGAYVVTSHGLRMPKAAYLCQRVLPAAYAALRTEAPGARSRLGPYPGLPILLARSHEFLMQLEGLGSFMAAQVIADLKNTEGHPLQKAEDWSYWSAPGPGSLRGLGWIFGKIPPSGYEAAIHQVESNLTPENHKLLWAPHQPRVNMQDLQNCLCEFDKFMRVMTKTGRSKRKYDGK